MLKQALVMIGLSVIGAMLGLTACSDNCPSNEPTGLGVSRSAIQSEFGIFDFETLPPRVDGQSAVIGRKFPGTGTREIIELVLVGPEHELTEATVLFSTEIDGQDALDVGAFISAVAPTANGVGWAVDGFHSGWTWDGFEEITGNKDNVHVRAWPPGVTSRPYFDRHMQAWRTLDFVSITFTPASCPP